MKGNFFDTYYVMMRALFLILSPKTVLRRFSQKWFLWAHPESKFFQIFLCFELEQIWDHINYTNAPHFYRKCDLRFALAQSIAEFWFCVVLCGHTETISAKTLSKTFLDITHELMKWLWCFICQKNSPS